LAKDEWLGAVSVFFWVFISTFPVAVPFIFIQNAPVAMRISNGVAIAMLFLTGFAYGRCVGRSPWLVGLSMVGLGAVLVALTIALGG
jgi:VIT1/CCC1 family predicted Fe2+/Mn2+ transporter